MRRIVFVLACLIPALFALSTIPAQALDIPDAGKLAETYRDQLRYAEPDTSMDKATAKARALAALKAQRWNSALTLLEKTVALQQDTDDPEVWGGLATVLSRIDPASDRAIGAAYEAFALTGDPAGKAGFLKILAQDAEASRRWETARVALGEALTMAPDPALQKHLDDLNLRYGFLPAGVRVAGDSDQPSACFDFTDALSRAPEIHFEDYVRIEPAMPVSVASINKTLCVEGLAFGGRYTIVLLKGLPGAGNHKLYADQRFSVTIVDRKPAIAFRGDAYILPKLGGQGLPLYTVNLDKVYLQAFRIDERQIAPALWWERLFHNVEPYSIQDLDSNVGEQVWQGTLATPGKSNQQTPTTIPVAEILKSARPGIYALFASSASGEAIYSSPSASQWILISDLGIETLCGSDGIHISVRSLETAKPQAGVALTLIARDNSELGKAVTDGSGQAVFPAGLNRAAGGAAPRVVMAATQAGDFNFLDLAGPAFDLSDRGVSGRRPPGPIDAFAYAERGVYRPGESVHLSVLLRDDQARAVENLPALLKLYRPDSVEARKITLTGDKRGEFSVDLPLSPTAMTGLWHAEIFTDPDGPSVGSIDFQVQDFVPARMAVALATDAKVLQAGKPASVAVEAHYYYGSPASDLAVQGTVDLSADPQPFADYAGYQFGLVQEEMQPQSYPIDVPETDAAGKTKATINLGSVGDWTRPLRASVRIGVFEPGGREVADSLVLPVRGRPVAIGLKPAFDGGVDEGSPSPIGVVALDADGRPIALKNAIFELVREDWDYQFTIVDGSSRYQAVTRDKAISTGRLDIAADGKTAFSRNLPWGDYRLEVYDQASGAASSVRFYVGWRGNGTSATPDRLEISLDKTLYKPGDTALVHLKAPFAGEAEIDVMSDKVLSSRTVTLNPDGTAELHILVDASWGVGAYVSAIAIQPAADARPEVARRAIGLVWAPIDETARTLKVSFDLPQSVAPRRHVDIPVKVAGLKPGEEGYVTLAAVDQGILSLTDFAAPDPAGYYFRQRELGFDIRDIYSKLIRGQGGPMGTLRSGGDTLARQLGAGTQTIVIVSLYSGPVRLDEKGEAKIGFDLPDFNGEVGLMAVAWSKDAVGGGDAALKIVDPLVVLTSLPRFLAPGDESQLTLSLDNVTAPAGNYHLTLKADGAVKLLDAEGADAPLAQGQKLLRAFRIAGATAGDARLTLAIDGPEGFHLAKEMRIGVRGAQPLATRFLRRTLQPKESVTVNAGLLAPYIPGTGELVASFSTGPNLDVPGLIDALDRYPYGCLEQLTSRALPLLYATGLAQGAGLETNDAAALKGRVVDAIGDILEKQGSSGGFGLWSAYGSTQDWLSAYALDFLTRAKAAGYDVPNFAYESGLSWLADRMAQPADANDRLAFYSYAFYVVAEAGEARPGDLRYFFDTKSAALPSELARAQIGAALTKIGDVERARQAFALVGQPLPSPTNEDDYGSALRDLAGVVALEAEAGERTALIEAGERLDKARWLAGPYLSTQEMAWLILAAHGLADTNAGVALAIGDQPSKTNAATTVLRPDPAQLAKGLKIVNTGTAPIREVTTLSGVPAEPQPAADKGYNIARAFYDLNGKNVDLAKVRQNDLMIVVITGEVTDQPSTRHALVVDLLPAGLEIENAALKGVQQTSYDWLAPLSDTVHSEIRDDRYVAALDVQQDGDQSFTLAYLARAVTPGTYVVPGAYVEDMYKPDHFGRGALDRLVITAKGP